jgi:hypothetical protein
MVMDRKADVGQVVVFHNARGVPHNALVTVAWTETCVNLVFVSGDEAKKDQYGRQIERETSVQHKSVQGVHGNYWRFPDEEPNPYHEPASM